MKYLAIVGPERSGTTYVGRNYSDLYQVPLLPELQVLHMFAKISWTPADAKTFIDYLYAWKKSFCLPNIKVEDVEPLFKTNDDNYHLKKKLIQFVVKKCLEAEGSSNFSTFIDHSSATVKEGITLSKYFDDSEFIFLVRDPRAVYSSIRPLDWGPNTPIEFSAWWGKRIGEILLNYSHFDINWLRYEDLSKLNSNSCLSASNSKFNRYTQSQHAQLYEPFDKRFTDKWKANLSSKDCSIIETELDVFLRYFSYERITDNVAQRSFKLMLELHIVSFGRFLINTIKNRRRRKNAQKNI